MRFFFATLMVIAIILVVASAASSVEGLDMPLAGSFGGGERTPDAAQAGLVVDRADDPVEILACTDAPNDCSLRSAIQRANEDGAPSTITFANHLVITLAAPLPALTESGTAMRAAAGQEVHINGNGTGSAVLRITGENAVVEGLRLYGAGAGFPDVWIGGTAHSVVIARNIIGDDDAPEGRCGSDEAAFGGIYIDGSTDVEGTRAWIYGNIIECHNGQPGDGITILADEVVVGADAQGQAGEAQRNRVQWNRGTGIRVGNVSGSTIRNNVVFGNGTGLSVDNYNNNILDNDIK